MLVTKDTSCSRLIILLPSGAGAAARTGCSPVERLFGCRCCLMIFPYSHVGRSTPYPSAGQIQLIFICMSDK